MKTHLIIALLAIASTTTGVALAEDTFSHDAPGKLVAGSGSGRSDSNVYAPTMRFPMEKGPAFANSQVWGHGGMNGPKGGAQCDKENFSYPWHDNYCESRSWDMPLCPSGTGHQGQDIRAATCEKGVHWVVATVDGTITNVGSYSVYLTASDGTRYDFLHMQDVTVKEGDKVKRGEQLGKVSNQFGGAATTVHLHFNIRQNVAGVGDVYVPPYLSLVASYDELLHPKPVAVPDQTIAIEPTEPPPAKEVAAAPLPPEPPPAPAAEADTGCNASSSSSSSSSSSIFGAALAIVIATVFVRRRRSG